MAPTKRKSSETIRLDRCANPFEIEGHRGKSLRNMSTTMLEKFGICNKNSKICSQCRNRFYENSKTSCIDGTRIEESDHSKVNNSEFDCDTDLSPPKKITFLGKKS